MAAAEGIITGTVNWFSVTKGYGFITRSDGGEDVFVHQSDLLADGFRSLHEGESVEFKMGSTEAGRPKAVCVTGPGGAAVKGVPKRGSGPREPREAGRGRGGAGAGKGERPAGAAGGGRTRGPRPPREEPQGESSGLQVVVLNLPWTATTEALKEFMAPAGKIEHAEVAADASGRARGYGVVKYATKEDAANAVESVNGKAFEERPVTVKLDRYG